MRCKSSWVLLLFFLFHSQSLIHSYSSPLHSSSSSSSSSPPLCHPTESSALLQFKSSFSINQNISYHIYDMPHMYPKTQFWKNGTNCCSWDGVLCDSNSGHVIGLDLISSCLQGPLHSNSTLFSLRHLQSLVLDYNDFDGIPVPVAFGGFSNLKLLSLRDTNFSGFVPVTLSHLSKLVQLHLTSSFSVNELKLETHVFKRMLQNLTNLRELSLCHVNMCDVEPVTSLMNISSSLMVLDLSGCQIRGKLEENIFRLPNLRNLNLWDNVDLIGSLPTFNWTSPLRYLSLSYTTISIDLLYLSRSAKSLRTLHLSNCSLRGSHTSVMANLTQLIQLTSLDLSYNNFQGEIPWSSLNIMQLKDLDLSENYFVGQIPETYHTNSTKISIPIHLKYLSLSHNLLSGSIPSWIFSLPSLQVLFLQSNQLTGYIKEFHSRSLYSLRLDLNKLHGQIPSSIFQQKNLNFLDLTSNNLSGVLELSMFSKLKNLQTLRLSFNRFSFFPNNSVENPFPKLQDLGLASCNISVFPYFLRSLERLDVLHLSHNQIRGRIPEWLWNERTHSLTLLNLSHNFLTHIDRIPGKNLIGLDLRSNMLQGNLPIVPPSLRFFSISNNQLSGEIPSLYCNLSALRILDLSNNSFQGNIPSCLGNQYSLCVLDLRMNIFSGKIPDMFEYLSELRSLHLKGNLLEGPLPRSLRNCQSLEVLDVGNNKIKDIFPHWLETLSMLQVLILKSNRFHGSIGNPKVKSPFQNLLILDLSHNEFNGLLPTKYFESLLAMMEAHEDRNLTFIGEGYYQDSVAVGIKNLNIILEKIFSIFTAIDFSRNRFEGEIPESIGKLKSLKGLNFSRNKLTGPIPTSLRNLTNLEWLDLSSNELVGEIPSQMVDLTQLQLLNLSQNQLVGPIPSGRQFNTFNNDSYSGNLRLCGFPLSKSCSKDETQQEDDAEEEEEHTDGLFDWKIVMMGYGCGIVIGISVGYMVLFSRSFDYWLTKRVGGRQRRSRTTARLRGRRRSN